MDRTDLSANGSEPGGPGNGSDNGAITPGRLGGPAAPPVSGPTEMRLRAAIVAAKFYGVDLDIKDFRATPGEPLPSPATLARWLEEGGLWARAARIKWAKLFGFPQGAPVVLLLKDGSAGVLAGVDQTRNVVFVRDPRAVEGAEPVAVDELRLRQLWDGDVLMVRRARGSAIEDEPFTFGWLGRLVLLEKKMLRDITVASIILSVLAVVPTFLVIATIDRVVVGGNINTLYLVAVILLICVVFDALLSYARRELVQVVSTRVDIKLNLHVFNRLLALPLDYFERNPTGQTTYRISQIFRIRDFLTGKLMNTFLDLTTLFILLPFLFYLSAALAWMVLAAAAAITLIIMVFLPSMRAIYARVVQAEVKKSAVLVESIHGIRTVKSLALEESQKTSWDERVAESAEWRLRSGRHSNIPQTLVGPFETFLNRGVVVVGAYIVVANMLAHMGSTLSPEILGINLGMVGVDGITPGALVGFMLLGGRVAAPLVNAARLMEDFEEVRTSVYQVGFVLNNPTETNSKNGGLRPTFKGAVSFEDLTFTYPLGKTPALDRVNFSVPAGTMLGVVGKSGSGKSTLARLLQGINREYTGYLKIDGTDLREINLTHLRRSFGTVLQDNFLFRGTVRENIIASRPGLTLEDAIHAARLAGAEEFIERLPAGYETYIEESSANLSGGQKQRLAIARALIADPRLMILDEATSALDPESEALVNANLLRIAAGRTMVIISHRLSSLVECDQILVMDKGTVADMATHKVLLERCAIYRQLWLQQNRHMNSSGEGRSGGIKPVLAEGDD